MKKKLFYAFSVFHVAVILWVSFSTSYTTYCDFYNKKQGVTLEKIQHWFADSKFFGIYMRYSGTETGYGFFAPNVRSNGLLLGETDKKLKEPVFHSYEGKNRFSSLSAQVTENILRSVADSNSLPVNTVAQKWENYYDIVLKGIVRKTYEDTYVKSDSLILSYNLIEYPALYVAKNTKTITPNLIKIKKLKFLNRHENSSY